MLGVHSDFTLSETPPHFTGGGGLAVVSTGLPPVCALAFGLLSVGQEASNFLWRVLGAGCGRANLLSEFLRAVRPCGLGPLTLSRGFRSPVTPADFPRWSGLAS